jgi:hypothetical protein
MNDRMREMYYVAAFRIYGYNRDEEALSELFERFANEPFSFQERVTAGVEEAGPMTDEEAVAIGSLSVVFAMDTLVNRKEIDH